MTATRVCERNAEHVQTETVDVTSEVTTPATCETKGKTTYTAAFTNAAFTTQTKVMEDVDALGHDWSAVTYTFSEDGKTCTASRTCGNDHAHDQSETVNCAAAVTTPATCETAGVTTYTANFANAAFETQTTTRTDVAALGHLWGAPTYVWAEDNSTVTATRVCERDAEHVQTETVNTTSAITAPATCTAMGWTTYTATFTNEAFTVQKKTVKDIDAIGHDWNYADAVFNWSGYTCANATVTCLKDGSHKLTVETTVTSETEAPTCEAGGQTVYVASFTVEGAVYSSEPVTQTLPAMGHRFPLTVHAGTAATCTENGAKTYYECEACHTYFEESAGSTVITEAIDTWKVIEKLGHDPAAAVTENDVAPTCTAAGHYDTVVYCKRCGIELSRETVRVEALGHQRGPSVKENEIAATCLGEGGYDTAVYCRRCEAELSRTHTVIEALGHDYTRRIVSDGTLKSAATCTEPAVYYCTCSRCTAIANSDEYTFIVGAPLGHTLETVEAIAPTCMAGGNSRYYHCTRCGLYFSDENAQHPTDPADHILPVDGNAHVWGEWTLTTAPTCSAEGEETRVCALNGEHKQTRPVEIDPDAHKPVIVDGREPTCTEIGYTGATVCEYCGTPLAANGQIPALGHAWGAWATVPGSEPTCTEAGVKTRVCGRCGETETGVEDPLGHDMQLVSEVAPTCTENGTKAYYACTRCEHVSSDAAGGHAIPLWGQTMDEYLYLRRLGHNYGEWQPIPAGEGAYDEEQHRRICANDPNHVEYEAHAWGVGMAQTAATCGSEGLTVYTCTVCGAEKREVTTPNGRHTWGEWTYDAASRTHSRVCEICGEPDADNCRFGGGQITAYPTFTAAGEKTYTCTVCGGTYSEPFRAEGMALSANEATLDPGATKAVTAYVLPGGAAAQSGVTWQSSDETVATVDESGVITAVNPGTAVISATAAGFVKTVRVTVTGSGTAEYLAVTADRLSTTQLSGTTITLRATLMPANVDPGTVEWYSSNSAVASVSDGLVTYVSAGTAIIYARTADGGAKGSITVRCTLDKSEVQNEERTFSVHFVVTDSGYYIKGRSSAGSDLSGSVTVSYAAGSRVEFRVKNDVYVLINGVRQPKSADRTYVIESIDQNYTVMTSANENAGLTPDDGGAADPNNGGSNGGGSGVCSYCGQVHTGLFGWLISFFHGILYFFKNMFNR